jgi:hypothetical protein
MSARIICFALTTFYVANLTSLLHATTYKATLLNPTGYWLSHAEGVFGGNQVGESWQTGSYSPHAMLWHGTPESYVDLNPAGFHSSFAYALSDTFQVGYGEGPSTDYHQHALLWSGTANSVVDLNPADYGYSCLYDLFEDYQVGEVSLVPIGGGRHATMWHGTAESAVELPAEGYYDTFANAAHGETQVGAGAKFQPGVVGNYHALLWHGPSENVIDLHPTGWANSRAQDVWGTSQCGFGYPNSLNGPSHAVLWNSTSASAVDLNPAGILFSEARGLIEGNQVGWGEGAITGYKSHALLWKGSAEDFVDLHLFLGALGPSFVSSRANAIAIDGTITGIANDSNNLTYSVLWTPIPEPTSFALFVCLCGLIIPLRSSRR